MVPLGWVFEAGFTDEDEVVAGGVRTVFVVTGFIFAVDALSYYLGMVTKVHAHAAIKDIELALPQPIVTVRFAVLYDTAVYLVDIFEATLFHHGAQ